MKAPVAGMRPDSLWSRPSQAQVALALLMASVIPSASALRLGDNSKWPVIPRRLEVWYEPGSSESALTQLEANASLFDVVFAKGCGLKADVQDPLKPEIVLDTQEYETNCASLASRAKTAGLAMQVWLPVAEGAALIPNDMATSVKVDVKPLVKSFSALAKEHGWSGIGFADETEGCSQKQPEERQIWLAFLEAWGRLMRYENLRFSVGVKLLNCPELKAKPINVEPPKLGRHFSNTAVDEWVETDTAEGSLASFYDGIDYYERYMTTRTLGIGMPPPDEQSLARVHAMDKAEAGMMVVSGLPMDTEYLRLLHNWKTRCDGCRKHGMNCWSAEQVCPS